MRRVKSFGKQKFYENTKEERIKAHKRIKRIEAATKN